MIAEGEGFFANWADVPAIAVSAEGTVYAHWLARTADETYAYSIFLARSSDGTVWSPMGTLNDDDTDTEHGFVSYVPEEPGLRAFWLDGREMATGGPMALRTALIGDEIGDSRVLDNRVCECCGTDAVLTASGPVVVTRDRSEEEIRDIVLVRRAAEGWSESERIAADDWRIRGCPVNGPAAAVSGAALAVVWYTAGGTGPRVQIAFSDDGGGSFGPPLVVDGGRPLGRVDIVEDDSGGFFVSWLEGADNLAEIRLRRFIAPETAGRPIPVARTSPSRASGFPRLARLGSEIHLAWVDAGKEGRSRVRLLAIPLDDIE